MKMPILNSNIALTPRAKELLRLTPNFDPDKIVQEDKIIPLLSWHPWRMTKDDSGRYIVDKGPFYNISSDNIGILSEIHQLFFFNIDSCLIAIAFAPYLNFSKDIDYEIDCPSDLVIYEKNILSI